MIFLISQPGGNKTFLMANNKDIFYLKNGIRKMLFLAMPIFMFNLRQKMLIFLYFFTDVYLSCLSLDI